MAEHWIEAIFLYTSAMKDNCKHLFWTKGLVSLSGMTNQSVCVSHIIINKHRSFFSTRNRFVYQTLKLHYIRIHEAKWQVFVIEVQRFTSCVFLTRSAFNRRIMHAFRRNRKRNDNNKLNAQYTYLLFFFFFINFIIRLVSVKYFSQRLRSNTNKFLKRIFAYFAFFGFKEHVYDFLVHILKMYQESRSVL